jgi:hypothetical protein
LPFYATGFGGTQELEKLPAMIFAPFMFSGGLKELPEMSTDWLKAKGLPIPPTYAAQPLRTQ